MLAYQKDVRMLMRERTSMRTYLPVPLAASRRRVLEGACRALRQGPLGTRCRFQLMDRGTAAGRAADGDPGGARLGTYGVIRGASTFLVGAAARGPADLLDFGFLFELLILKAAELGLGTCWLGGTFRRSDFARTLQLEENEVLPAVSPVGIPARRRSLLDRLFRLGAGSRLRRPWEGLFFDSSGKPLSPAGTSEPHRGALEMLRLAPSASNCQPWRALLCGKELHLFLCRTPGYGHGAGVDLQRLDIGIAMAHFELALRAAETGTRTGGRWQVLPALPADAQRAWKACSFQNLEYMVSWRPKG